MNLSDRVFGSLIREMERDIEDIKKRIGKKPKSNLIRDLERIRDIPINSSSSCHRDHMEMSKELNKVIKVLKRKELGKC